MADANDARVCPSAEGAVLKQTEEEDVAELPAQRLGARLVCFGAFSAGFSYACIMVISLPFSVNFIVNSGVAEPTAQSQLLYSMAFVVKQLGSVLFAAALGELGNCIGRQKVCLIAIVGYSLVSWLSLLANVTSQVGLHILAQFLLGSVSPFLPSGTAYMMDVSAERAARGNLGVYVACNTGGFAFGFVVAAVLTLVAPGIRGVNMQYVAAGTVTTIAAATMMKLPDISPAMSARRAFDKSSAIPLYALRTMRNWTPYMRYVLLAGAVQAANVADGQAYLLNYILVRFYGDVAEERKASTLAMLLVFMFSAGSLTSFLAMRCFRSIPYLYAATAIGIFQSLLFILTPSKPFIPWILIAVGSLTAAMPISFINIFYGQVAQEKRGELAGAFKCVDSFGRLVGSPIGGAMGTAWLSSKELQRSLQGFPAFTGLGFSILVASIFVANERIYGHQNVLDADGRRRGKTASPEPASPEKFDKLTEPDVAPSKEAEPEVAHHAPEPPDLVPDLPPHPPDVAFVPDAKVIPQLLPCVI